MSRIGSALLSQWTGPSVAVVSVLVYALIRFKDSQGASGPRGGRGVDIIQVFTHAAALKDNPDLPAKVEGLCRSAAWRVERGFTELAIHARGVWVHGGDAVARSAVLQLLRAGNVEATVDDRDDGAPLQVIVGAVALPQ